MVFFGGRWATAVSIALLGVLSFGQAKANPALVVDVDSGDVLYQTMATDPWFPASLTKLMTTYVALSAVREGRITLNTPMMVSARAASMKPSKMGFRPGTLVTLDNALKMLMVKSPNDIAVTIAEGIGGSVEGFADQMNAYAARLGLHESHFVNPNGLPDPAHVSSARDMAMVGRALLREFPEEHDLFGIGELAFGAQLIRNHNGLLGRYPGVDGMKTGYTCSAGYNVVLSAQRNDRRLITVVMGAPSTSMRNQRAATLFDKYFAGSDGSQGQLSNLPPSAATMAPDLRSVVCGRGRGDAIAEAEAEDASMLPAIAAASPGFMSKSGAMERGGTAPATTGPGLMAMQQVVFTPVRVFVGPVDGWTGPIAHAKTMSLETTDLAAAPTPSKLRATAAPLVAAKGPSEASAPAPMALLGATAPLPATLATGAFAKKGKPLSLKVPARKKVSRVHAVDPKFAAGTTPSILAKAEDPKAAPVPAAPHAIKPVAKAAVAKPAAAKPAATKTTTAAERKKSKVE